MGWNQYEASARKGIPQGRSSVSLRRREVLSQEEGPQSLVDDWLDNSAASSHPENTYNCIAKGRPTTW